MAVDADEKYGSTPEHVFHEYRDEINKRLVEAYADIIEEMMEVTLIKQQNEGI